MATVGGGAGYLWRDMDRCFRIVGADARAFIAANRLNGFNNIEQRRAYVDSFRRAFNKWSSPVNMSKEEREHCEAHRDETRDLNLRLAKMEIWIKIAAISAAASVLGGNVGADMAKKLIAGL